MAETIPSFLVIKSNDYKDKACFIEYKLDDGSVVLTQEQVFRSTLFLLEAERSVVHHKYVHLRFRYVNKYMEVKENDKLVVAVSSQPEDDTGKASCTLFEPVIVDADKRVFYLVHVHSGGRVMVDGPGNPVFVEKKAGGKQGYLEYVDWESIVKLPPRVAFVGENNKYLQTHSQEGHTYLQFSSDDASVEPSGHHLKWDPDGHVRLTSDGTGMFWRRSPNWIWPDYLPGDEQTTPKKVIDTIFWPVKVDYDTIALRNAGNHKYCKPLTAGGRIDCLNAAAAILTDEALLYVRERVASRKILDVRFQLQYARVHNEVEKSLSSVSVVNEGDSEASVAVKVEYEDLSSYYFDRTWSLLAGVPTSIESGLPMIEGDGSVSVKQQIKEPLIWGQPTIVQTPGTAFGTFTVPPRSSGWATYIATLKQCDIPFYYGQLDQEYVNDPTTRVTEQPDGM